MESYINDEEDNKREEKKLEISTQNLKIKRLLTRAEILYIIDFLELDPDCDIDVAVHRFNKYKEELIKSLYNTEIYIENDDVIQRIRDKLEGDFIKSRLHPGMMVGAICAGACGMPTTQMVLNSFHSSGSANVVSVSGVGRIEEIISGTKKPKKTSLEFKILPTPIINKLKNDMLNSQEQDVFINKLKYIKYLRDLTRKEFEEKYIYDILKKPPEIHENITLNDEDKIWYDFFKKWYHNDFQHYNWSIRLTFDVQHIYDYKLQLYDISKKIEKFGDLRCVFSPNHIGIIDVYIDTNMIKEPEEILKRDKKNIDGIDLKRLSENKEYYFIRDVVINYVNFIKICGINDINNIYFIEDFNNKGDFIIQTDGSNLQEIIKHPLVDFKTIDTNFWWEALQILGIEACRNVLKNELVKCFGNGGININKCQYDLIVDSMCHKGVINACNRYGIDSSSPLTKSSFEMSSINMINASKYAERDNLKGISANVIMGKLTKAGTGYPVLLPNIKMLKEYKPLLSNIKENVDVWY